MDGLAPTAAEACAPGNYAMYDLAAALRCETSGGWAAVHFLSPMFVYATVQNVYVAALTPGLFEVFEAVLRAAAWWWGAEGVRAAASAGLRFQTPAGALLCDWMLQGLWGVVAGVLLVRVTGIPRVVPIYGHWRTEEAQDGGGGGGGGGGGRSRGGGEGEGRVGGARTHQVRHTFPHAFNPLTWNGVPDDLRNAWPLRLVMPSSPPDCPLVAVVHDRKVGPCSMVVGSRNERVLATSCYSATSLAVALESLGTGAGVTAMLLAHVAVIAYVLETTPWPARRVTGSGPPLPRGVVLALWLAAEALLVAAAVLPPRREAWWWIGVTQAAIILALLLASVVLSALGR